MLGLGDKGVATLSPTLKAFERLLDIYDVFQSNMEISAYVNQNTDGRNVRQKFPISGLSESFINLRDQFKDALRVYKAAQTVSMQEHPDLTNDPLTPGSKAWLKAQKLSEKNCWMGSEDNERIIQIQSSVDHTCSLVNLREQFETQVK